MKYGYRTPSIKKSISSQTTGKINRSVKSAVNPLYNKKGMGYINNPHKAMYNKIYNKTTVGVVDKSLNHNEQKTNYNKEYNGDNWILAVSNIIIFIVSAIFIIPFIWIVYKVFSFILSI